MGGWGCLEGKAVNKGGTGHEPQVQPRIYAIGDCNNGYYAPFECKEELRFTFKPGPCGLAHPPGKDEKATEGQIAPSGRVIEMLKDDKTSQAAKCGIKMCWT